MAPNKEAWGRYFAKMGVLDLALVVGSGHLAAVGGIVPGFGTWGGVAKEAGTIKARRDTLFRTWQPKQEAYDKQREALWKRAREVKKSGGE